MTSTTPNLTELCFDDRVWMFAKKLNTVVFLHEPAGEFE